MTILIAGAISILPTSAACTFTPIVSLDGTIPPSDGVYVQQGCHGDMWGYGAPAVSADASPQTVPTCAVIPAVFVLGTQVPGTGATACAPASAYAPASGLPDIGVIVCYSFAGCTWVSSDTLTYYCENLGVGADLGLPTGDEIQVACTTT